MEQEKGQKLTICFLGEAKNEDIHTVKWARHFSDRGHEVHLFSYPSFSKKNMVEGITVHLLKKRSSIKAWPFVSLLNIPSILAQIKRKMKEINPDIIHAHCLTSYGTLGSLLNFHPFIITAFGSDILITPKENIMKGLITRWSLAKADLITCDAFHMREAIMKFGVPESKIKIIFFGVDTKKFSPGPKNEEIKRKFGILDEDRVVMSFRFLEPLYDTKTLIQSVPTVLKEVSGVKFLIAGNGSQEKKLKKMSEDLRVSEKVKFIGWIDKEVLPQYLRTVDVCVSTALSDAGIASSTAEAMACGLSVIVTNTGENEKWVKNGENGFLIPIKNPEILAERIVRLLKDDDLRRQFGERARKVIEERDNYQKEMEKVENIYYQLSKNLRYGEKISNL